MTSVDDNRTPPFLNDDEEDDIGEEDTEEEEEEEDDDDEGELTAGINDNNIIHQEEDDDDHDPTASLNSDPTKSVTIAVPPPIAKNLPESAPKRLKIIDDEPDPPIRVVPISSSQQQQATGDNDQARKLFQRLWTDEDEIGLLQGFLDYSTQRGKSQNNPHDTALFYDQIKSKLQLDFNKNQLVEKLRRLKKKYRNVLARISSGKEISFKSPHDQATFDIATKIWGHTHNPPASTNKDHHDHVQHNQNYQQQLQRRIDVDDDMPPNFNPASTNLNLNFASHFNSSHHSDRVIDERKSQQKSSKKRFREKTHEVLMDHIGAATLPAGSSHVQIPTWPQGIGLSTPVMPEEKAKNKVSPMFRDMYDNRSGGSRGFVDGIVSPVPLNFATPAVNIFGGMEAADDRWRKQQILELEVYSKRLELVQEQIKLTLEQLRSNGS